MIFLFHNISFVFRKIKSATRFLGDTFEILTYFSLARLFSLAFAGLIFVRLLVAIDATAVLVEEVLYAALGKSIL